MLRISYVVPTLVTPTRPPSKPPQNGETRNGQHSGATIRAESAESGVPRAESDARSATNCTLSTSNWKILRTEPIGQGPPGGTDGQ